MNFIDIRSDTVTQQTDEMRRAMFEASVGDDVYGDDETINKLEHLAAKMLGKEAALFVPSGTFSNQLALFTHCPRGTEVILPDDSHIIQHEVAASSIIAGVQLRAVPPSEAENIDSYESRIRKLDDIHQPKTALFTYEQARSNGKVMSFDFMKNLHSLAKKYQIPIHVDGARFFNAAVALNVEVRELAETVDSVSICLSKGLCSPVGSLLVGTKSFVELARKKRKIMGGGLRQAGFLAACGIISLEKMTKRLNVDHENAKALAEKLSKIPGINVLRDCLDINMVFFSIAKKIDENAFCTFMKNNGVLINPAEPNSPWRFMTHYWIDKEKVDIIAKLTEKFLSENLS